MAFILGKDSVRNGEKRKLYYLVESYREGGKIKRRTIYKLRERESLTEEKQEIVELIKEEERMINELVDEVRRLSRIERKGDGDINWMVSQMKSKDMIRRAERVEEWLLVSNKDLQWVESLINKYPNL